MRRSSSAGCLKPMLAVLGPIAIFAYGVIALMSQDPVWFLTRASVPNPQRIVVRVDGEETVVTASESDYDPIVEAVGKALSSFKNWAPGSVGLSERTLNEYQSRGTVLELYFAEPVDFHLPFNDGEPTALLIPVEGRYGGEGYVFRGKHGQWWAGQLTVRDPQPLVDALSSLGYIQR